MEYTTNYGSLMGLTQVLKAKQASGSINNKKFIVLVVRFFKTIEELMKEAFVGKNQEEIQAKMAEKVTFKFDDKVSVDIETKTDARFDLAIASALISIFGSSFELSIDGEKQLLD